MILKILRNTCCIALLFSQVLFLNSCESDSKKDEPQGPLFDIWTICPWDYSFSGMDNCFIGSVVSISDDIDIKLESSDPNMVRPYVIEPVKKNGGYYYAIYMDLQPMCSEPANNQYISGYCNIIVTDNATGDMKTGSFQFKQYKKPIFAELSDGKYQLISWKYVNYNEGVQKYDIWYNLDKNAPHLCDLTINNGSWTMDVKEYKDYPLRGIVSGEYTRPSDLSFCLVNSAQNVLLSVDNIYEGNIILSSSGHGELYLYYFKYVE